MKFKFGFLLFTISMLVNSAEIHYEGNADPAVKYAASDMARCLRKVTGKEWGCRQTGTAVKGDIVLTVNPQLREQEWRFQTKDGILCIQGNGTVGMVYGIYTFLEKYAGCAWFAPDTESLPNNPDWKLPELNETGRPVFLRREMFLGYDYGDGLWRMRNKETNRASYGIGVHTGSPFDCHTFDYYVKSIKNPDLFGKTRNGNPCKNLCMTNPEVRKIVAEQMLRYIEADRKKARPSYTAPMVYDLSQPDGASGGECWCDGCSKLAEEEGSYAGPNIAFVNAVAAIVKEKYPDVMIQTFAYSYTMTPPKKIKAADNVIVRFCDSHLFRPLLPGISRGDDLESWGKHAGKKAIWSYWRTYSGSLYPFVKKRKDIAAELRFCAKENVISYYAENEDPLSRSFAMQQNWLMLKMLEDPSQDIEKLNDRFLGGYYGKAASFMKQYLEYLERRQDVSRSHLDREFFEKVNSLLDQAEKAVADDPLSLAHVHWERIVVDRAMFQNLNTLQKSGFQPDLKAAVARFKHNSQEQLNGWKPLKINKLLPERLILAEQEAELYSHYPASLPTRFNGCDVIDIAWNQLGNAGSYVAVKDSAAICGTAVMNPKYRHHLPFSVGYYNSSLKKGNGISLSAADIPQDEKFHLYKLGTALIMAPLYVHFDDTWHFRKYLPTIGILGEVREIWISIKFAGPYYVKGSKQKNAVLYDRILLVRDPNPLRGYKNVDAASNLVKNGGFEQFSSDRIAHWGSMSETCRIDSKIRHSGEHSVSLGNVPNGYTHLAYSLGSVEELKDDLLIRGWFKYDGIRNDQKHTLPFIGLWTTANGRNSYSLPVAAFYPGSQDWQQFETIVSMEDFKRSCLRSSKKPDTVFFRINLYNQPGTVWVDDVEVIPLQKK